MKFPALKIQQGENTFYTFTCMASELWAFSKINQRQEDKDKGYQRVLSSYRVKQIKEFLMLGNAIPGSIIISCDEAVFHKDVIEIPDKDDAAWIIDGQHRCAGAAEAARSGYDVCLPIVAFINLTEQQQADYFVTINREAKGVPSSLYLDLLRHLPKKKSEKERLEERIADISRELTREPDSVFYQRIVSTTSPRAGQVSLTNFARRLRPVLHSNTGLLSTYTYLEQLKIIDNFFEALRSSFPDAFSKHIFFKTLGFGAVWRAFPTVFSASLKRSGGGFTPVDAAKVLLHVADFDFGLWGKMGTGSAAETQAGNDLITELNNSLSSESQGGGTIRL